MFLNNGFISGEAKKGLVSQNVIILSIVLYRAGQSSIKTLFIK
jgi:hypothetical protein